MQISRIGLDIAKNVFQVHGIDAAENCRCQLVTGDQKDTPLDEMLLQLGVCRGGFL
jgi:hypothetical protein